MLLSAGDDNGLPKLCVGLLDGLWGSAGGDGVSGRGVRGEIGANTEVARKLLRV